MRKPPIMTEFEERLESMKCSSCMFWSPSETGDGLCRKTHPQAGEHGTLWPRTNLSDWCGEHEQLSYDALRARWYHLRKQTWAPRKTPDAPCR